MIRRYVIACFLFSAVTLIPHTHVAAQSRSMRYPVSYSMQAQASREAAIRRMPLLQRPNRPGHFIGNTIRNMSRRSRGRW